MFKQNETVYAEVLTHEKSVYSEQCDSSLLDIHEIEERNIPRKSRNMALDCISTKLVKFRVNFAEGDEIRSFVVPLLH